MDIAKQFSPRNALRKKSRSEEMKKSRSLRDIKNVSFESSDDIIIPSVQHTIVRIEDYVSISISSSCEVEVDVKNRGKYITLRCNKPIKLNMDDAKGS